MQPWTLRDIMSRSLITVQRTATLLEAAQILEQRGVQALLVVDARGTPMGVLSRTDLGLHELTLAHSRTELVAPLTGRVIDVMTPLVVALDESTPVTDAARLMVLEKLHRVLVERQGKVVGLASLTDIARLVGEVGVGAPERYRAPLAKRSCPG